MAPDKKWDRIHLRDLVLSCTIGVHADERKKKQKVVLHLTLFADLAKAGRSDRLEDTVDYEAIRNQVAQIVQESHFCLLERLGGEIARVCLSNHRVRAVKVCVEKPSALISTRSVGIEIYRERKRP